MKNKKIKSRVKKVRDTSTALRIRHIIGSYFIKKLHAVNFEVGLNRSGSLRADLISVNMGSLITIVEVKSSVSDFRSDKKWREYMKHCDRFFFAIEDSVYAKIKDEIPKGVGIFVIKNGYAKIKQISRHAPIESAIRLEVITRMAYRSATMNARKHKNKVDVGVMVACDIESHITKEYPKMPIRATQSIKDSIIKSLKIHTT